METKVKSTNEIHGRPMKKFYRQRAHCNPLSHNNAFAYPLNPEEADWKDHYPLIENAGKKISILDVGCGFGGLSVLSKLFPDDVILGLEIRHKLVEYVKDRILNLRDTNEGEYQNISVLRTNAMKYLPNFINKGQLSKMFFCFADPQFKINNHRRRIISPILLSEYSYFLKPGGRIYTITDVLDLYNWHLKFGTSHPNFRVVNEDEYKDDSCIELMKESTEEGKKVTRNGGSKYIVVFEKLPDDKITSSILLSSDF